GREESVPLPRGERDGYWPSQLSTMSPDADLGFEIEAVRLVDLGADQVDQPQHIVRGRALVGDQKVGVAVAHLAAADAGPLEAGLFDQRTGVQPAGIAEDAAGRLKSQRLRFLLHDPVR